MTQLQRFRFMFISTALVMALIGGCAPPATPTRVAEEQPESPWVDVRVIPSGEPLVSVVQTEKIVQPNCGGTLEVENVVQRSRTIIHTVELGGGVEVNARGEVGLLGTGVQVGAAIAAQYGQSYGTEDTLTRAITVKAKQGTNMEHTIQQVEIWQLGTAEITIGDQRFTYPYQFRNDFSVELVKSQNIGCPPAEGVPSTPTATPTNTLTPEPALPTDTPTPKLAALTNTPTPEPTPTFTTISVPSSVSPMPTSTPEPLVAKSTIGAGDITQYRTWRPDKVIEVGGTIDKDTVWTAGNLYVITQDLSVSQGIVLTIQPGVVIKVSGRGPGGGDYYASAESLEQRNLFVAGTLLAEGTEEQPIIFTSLQDDTVAGDTNGDASNSSPAPGNWGRIEMSTGSDASILRHVEIRYGGAQAIGYSENVQSHAVLSLRGASPTIQNVTLTRNYERGIWVDQGSRATITNCRIEDNGSSGIWVSEGSSPSITNNIIARNEFWAIGAHPEWLPQLQGNRLLGNGFNGLGLYSGQIAESSNWYLTEHPIGILGDITVVDGAQLTIQPGVVIKVSGRGPGQGDYYASAESLEQRNLFVAGTLLAEGTEEQPIIFTSLQDDTVGGDTNGDASNSSPTPGNWGRIEMSTGSDASILRHVEIRYGGAQAIRNSDGVQSHAVLSLRGASPTIQNVTLTRNYEKGIWVDQGSRATITNSRIEDNGGAGIWVSEGSSPSITNNIIARNESWAIGAHPEWLPQLQGNRLLGNGFNGLGLYSGQIAESSNWYLTEHPIGILGDITVVDGAQLTIQPGVVIKVSGRGPGKGDYYASAESLEQRNLFVAGTLLAEGTEEQPIIFTSLQDDTVAGDTNGDASNSSPAPGNWGRIEMSTGSDASILRHVEIRYGGAQAIGYSENVQSHAVLSLKGPSPLLDSVVILYAYDVQLSCESGANPKIVNSQFVATNCE